MFRDNTLFVVGAGASFELGMPLGKDLKDTIAELLQVHIRRPDPMSPDEEYDWPSNDEFYQLVHGQRKNLDTIRSHMLKWRQIREGIHFSASIDNYLHNRSDDRDLVRIGKFAVARIIADAEQKLATRCISNTSAWVRSPDKNGLTDPNRIAWTTYFAEQ